MPSTVYLVKSKKKKASGARRRPGLRRKWRTRNPRRGGFYIKRKMEMFGLRGSTTSAGVIVNSAPSPLGNVFLLGAPVAAASGGTNLFDVPFSCQFSLNQAISYGEITNIADKYRLVTAKINVMTSNVALGAGAGLVMPFIEYVVDRDDAGAVTIPAFRQKQGIVTKGFNQKGQLSMYVKPVPAGLLYNDETTVAYDVPRRSPYIDCNSAGVPHYGIKGVIRSVFLPGTANTANFAIDAELTIHAKDLQ